MKAKNFDSIIAIVVPVSALRTEKSCGIGEFLDLIELAKFCKDSNISMIQILPVNDSGFDSSPYNLVSAFALNPCYISLEMLPNAQFFLSDINAIKEKFDSLERVAYQDVLFEKLKLAKLIFEKNAKNFTEKLSNKNSEESKWIKDNSWLTAYVIYKNIKAQNFQRSWKTWKYMRTPTKNELKQAWECPPLKNTYNFYIWLQFYLHKQLLEASTFCQNIGIMLKGDLPILMAEDSCDVWENHELFRSDLTAGTPPDFDNPNGQNWGFPCYFWQNHRENGYKWWKQRLKKSDQYYNAFRLDHILGFFRIWAIPIGESTAKLGRMVPYITVSKVELQKLGFSEARIRWMSEPHISTENIMKVNNNDYLNSHGELRKVCDRVNEEELWVFKATIKCESDLQKYNLKPACEKLLRQKWLDRMLIQIRQKASSEQFYSIAWNFQDSTAWNSLSQIERRSFLELQERQNEESENIWKSHGREILTELCSSVSMQAFAEDLGVIPLCVPEVLQELNIFSLKVIRWQRDWKTPFAKFIPIQTYNPISLTTPATHDTSTLKTWWETELSVSERIDLLEALNIKSRKLANENLSSKNANILLKAIAKSPSKVVAFQLQDLLTLSEIKFKGDMRINTPGMVSDKNWTYRMPVTIEKLILDKKFIAKVKDLKNPKT